MSKFYVFVLYVRACIVRTVFFFIDNVVRLLSYVNICARHVYLTINLLSLLTKKNITKCRGVCFPPTGAGGFSCTECR